MNKKLLHINIILLIILFSIMIYNNYSQIDHFSNMNDIKEYNESLINPLFSIIFRIADDFIEPTGLNNDYNIFIKYIKDGYVKDYICDNNGCTLPKYNYPSVKYNIFLEHIYMKPTHYKSDNKLYSLPTNISIFQNKKNIFMINQEIDIFSFWNNPFCNELMFMKYIDYVIVKHKGAERLLKEYRESSRCKICFIREDMHHLTQYYIPHTFEKDDTDLKYKIINTRFTSKNKCTKNISMLNRLNYDTSNLIFVHIAGQSNYKNTDIVLKTFIEYPELGSVDVICRKYCKDFIYNSKNLTEMEKLKIVNNEYKNIKYYSSKLDDISKYYDTPYIHICPSTAEGYGHYISEARRCGQIIITTDDSPMNNLVKDDVSGIIIETNQGGYIGELGQRRELITSKYLKDGINKIKEKTNNELNNMSKNAIVLSKIDDIYFDKVWSTFLSDLTSGKEINDVFDS